MSQDVGDLTYTVLFPHYLMYTLFYNCNAIYEVLKLSTLSLYSVPMVGTQTRISGVLMYKLMSGRLLDTTFLARLNILSFCLV